MWNLKIMGPLALPILTLPFLFETNALAYKRVIHTSGELFKDDKNRTLILRGFSVAGNSKLPPFQVLEPKDLDPLPGLGTNVIRLLFNWEAFEPTQGKYNIQYLNNYDRLIEHAKELDIYVIVDMHQDAYSRFNLDGCGDGFPRWSVPDTIVKVHAPDNDKNCKSWGFKSAFDSQLKKTWNLFYANHNGVRSRFLDLWNYLSHHFRDFDNVIGYDMLNEPGGDEKTQIGPLYEELANIIRKNDPDSILFITPQFLKSTGAATTLLRPNFENIVYSTHFYDVNIAIFNNWIHFSNKINTKKIRSKAKEWKVPLFMGEFGGPESAIWINAYINEVYNELDREMGSGAQWVYTPGWTHDKKDGWNQEDFSIIDDKAKLRRNFNIRPYPSIISGEPVKNGLKVEVYKNKSMSFKWNIPSDMVGATTVLFAPKTFFTKKSINGNKTQGSIRTSQGLRCEYQSGELLVHCVGITPGVHEVRID